MKFINTRNTQNSLSAKEVIFKSICGEYDVYVPENIPFISEEEINLLCEKTYDEKTAFILNKFFEELDENLLNKACKMAYCKFEMEDPAPLIALSEDEYFLELFHGATHSYKDLVYSVFAEILKGDQNKTHKKTLTFTVSNGDACVSALEYLKNNADNKIIILHDKNISTINKLVLTAQKSCDAKIIEIDENLSNSQNIISIFSGKNFPDLKDNTDIISANSINIFTIIPLIAVYFSAYCDLINTDIINYGEKINFSIPAGDLDNLTAALYAKKMGLPIGKIICAETGCNYLTDFFKTGKFNSVDKANFCNKYSPYHFERLLFEFVGRDSKKLNMLIENYKNTQEYCIDGIKFLTKDFFPSSSIVEEQYDIIAECFDEFGYVCDMNTAATLVAGINYRNCVKNSAHMIYLSVEHPYKNPCEIYYAITDKKCKDPFYAMEKLF